MILLIESNPQFREKIQRHIDKKWLVHSVATLAEANRWIHSVGPKAIVLDLTAVLNLAELEALLQYRAESQCPILFIEGHKKTTELAQRLRQRGEKHFISFPFRVSELNGLLTQLIADGDPLIGAVIGPEGQEVSISRKLGAGSMGSVYEGFQPSLQRKVAVKFLEDKSQDMQDSESRFFKEARALAQIRSPHVVQIYYTGHHQHYVYLVMELIDGCDLRKYLQGQETLGAKETLKIVDQILTGLEAVHKSGKVHRDIKPGNVMMNKEGQAILLDFGLVREGDEAGQTQPGTVLGTPLYLSPEQARGEMASQRSDLYSVGILLFELYFGYPPFTGDAFVDILMKHINQPMVKPPDKFCDPNVWLAIETLTQKDPIKRPSDATAAKHFLATLSEASGSYVHTQIMVLPSGMTHETHDFRMWAAEIAQLDSLGDLKKTVCKTNEGYAAHFSIGNKWVTVQSQRKMDRDKFISSSPQELAQIFAKEISHA